MRLLLILFLLSAQAGQTQLRVEPGHWWAGMSNTHLQLLVHGMEIGSTTPALNYPGVAIRKFQKADSPNYLFIDLEIAADTKPGSFKIEFRKDERLVATYEYRLLERSKATARQGFNSSDVIYLITPDRFANGDPRNDIVKGMRETVVNRKDDQGRHGGDIRGIINSLDYIRSMGFTAIWPTPMLENDMTRTSYHGYAITDHYKVDPRMGSMQEYIELGEKCREKGIKLIFDAVANHTGSEYWWMRDLPFRDWINFPDSFRNTSHRRTVNQDPYASQSDRTLMVKGWFVSSMPDLNQENQYVANYIIQNNIWWIETLGLAGIRQDTYPYSSKKFLSDWTCRILREYPQFSIVGEEWTTNPLTVAYWQQGKSNSSGYEGCMQSTMDFPMQSNLVQALTEQEGWNTGLIRLYEGLSNDFVYASPKDLLIFGDNHDMDRLFTQVKEDPALHRMALTWLLTSRGIPQLYYGTEVLMQNTAKPGDHGLIRSDFPGGWKGDAVNAITGTGLSAEQKRTQDYLVRLLTWRKNKTVVHEGNTLHFVPENGIYVYFRYDSKDTLMVVMNKNDKAVKFNSNRYNEIIGKKSRVNDVISGTEVSLADLEIPARTAVVYEMK